MKNEKDVKTKVKKLLDTHGWFWWMPPANGFGQSGISDFNAVKNGVFLAIETKFGPNKPTAMQGAFLRSINQESCFGFVVTEKTLEWFDTFLSEFQRSTDDVSEKKQMAHESGAALIDAIRALQALI